MRVEPGMELLQDDALARAKLLSLIPVIDADPRIRAWRKEGRIFAVEHGGVDLYPAFQFGDDGRPLPMAAELLQVLGRDAQCTDWQNAFWFVGPNSWLRGATPKDLLHSPADRDRPLEAARQAVLPPEY